METVLGVLGGVGPLATVYFADMLVRMTDAKTDQEHVSALIFNHSTIPDRTAYILGQSDENPLPVMIRDARLLEQAGASYIVIPCNTAHYFYEEIQASVGVPIINIIHETVDYIVRTIPDVKKIGIMATKGTIYSGSYKRECEKYGIECISPSEDDTETLMRIIYDGVKAAKAYDTVRFYGIIANLKAAGCDAVIMGCTELSIIHTDLNIKAPDIVDSLEVLARVSIERCGKKLKR